MSRVKNRATRKDRNHPDIVAAFRANGFHVLDISGVPNACDIMISKDGKCEAVEIKDGAKPPSARRLTKGEEKFKNEFLGKWWLVKDLDDVTYIVEAFNKQRNEK